MIRINKGGRSESRKRAQEATAGTGSVVEKGRKGRRVDGQVSCGQSQWDWGMGWMRGMKDQRAWPHELRYPWVDPCNRET